MKPESTVMISAHNAKRFNGGLRVLSYGDVDKLTKNMNHHFLDQLSLASDEMTQEPRTIRELNDYVASGRFTHVLVPDENFHRIKGTLEGCVVPVVGLLGDHYVPWAIERKKHYLLQNGIRNVFVFTDRFVEPYVGITNPHPILIGFDASTFFDRKKERDIDVLIHGSLGDDTYSWVYPVRNWLANTLPEIGIKEGIKVERLPHPGYETSNGEKATTSYAQMLNRTKIATGGSSFWRLALKKFYEVTASGAILLTDMPYDDVDFFRGRILTVDPTKLNLVGYEDSVRRMVMDTLEEYETQKSKLQPFRSEQQRFDRSYEGRALEMRRILKQIK